MGQIYLDKTPLVQKAMRHQPGQAKSSAGGKRRS